MKRQRWLTMGVLALACALLAGLPGKTAEAQTLSQVLAYSQGTTGLPPAAPESQLFGAMEFTSGSLKALPQWQAIVTKMPSESRAFAACLEDAEQCTSASERAWRQLQLTAAPLAPNAQLQAVNRFFNSWPYKSDQETYGRRELWATPRQFMVRSGDCEDYAIAKFFALRQLGFRNEDLRIVVLYDRVRGLGHAVLAVYVENDVLILDSLSNLITSHTRYRHYIPQYSMNETIRWAHVDQTRSIPQTALRSTDN